MVDFNALHPESDNKFSVAQFEMQSDLFEAAAYYSHEIAKLKKENNDKVPNPPTPFVAEAMECIGVVYAFVMFMFNENGFREIDATFEAMEPEMSQVIAIYKKRQHFASLAS